jgi:hypothetical protein
MPVPLLGCPLQNGGRSGKPISGTIPSYVNILSRSGVLIP